MIRRLSLLAAIIGLVILWAFTLWVLQEPTTEETRLESPHYHGADVITTGWKGEMAAYRWEKGTYKLMWKRRGKG